MKITLRAVTEISVAVAMSVIFNFLPLWKMPQGGSISLEMLPIFIITLRWGLKEGMLAGLVYGLIQLAFNPFIVHPIQLILDYPLPYMLLGTTGFLKNRLDQNLNKYKKFNIYLIIALSIGGLLRLFSHILSGAVFFAQYAPENTNVWIYSTIYNATFILPSLFICYLIIMILKDKLIYND